MENIQSIKVSEIFEHPDNPRKDLGDISELSDSIKQVGILQNLTVVPGHTMSEDEYIKLCKSEGVSKSSAKATMASDSECLKTGTGYTVIIGHRRLAAAKQAGLTEVPCVIADMDYKQQIRTMMMENMQRQDLTILEQADGFQMMIDLGDSIKDIAKDTGFSQTTIKHRVKLLDLDRSKLDKAVKERPIKMEDLIKLEAVKDPKKKDELVAVLGTNNFNWKLHDILEGQKWEKDKVKILAAIEGFAKKIPSSVDYWQLDFKKRIEAKDIKDGIVVGFTPEEGREYFYRETQYNNYIELYLKPKGFDKQQEQAKKEAAKAKAKEKSDKELAKINKEIGKQIDAAEAKVAALHMEFLAEFFKGGFFRSQPKDLKPVIQTFLKTIDGYEFGFGMQGRAQFMKDFLGIDFEEDCEEDAILEHLEDKAFDILLFYMITQIMDNTDSPYFCQQYGDYSIRFNLKDNIVDLRDMLEALGYEASDEEEKFYNGGLLNEQPGDEEVSDSE